MKKPASPPQPFACATARAARGWAATLGEPESAAVAVFSSLPFLPFLPFASLPLDSLPLPFACLPAGFCGSAGGAAVAGSLIGGCSATGRGSVAVRLMGFQQKPPAGAIA